MKKEGLLMSLLLLCCSATTKIPSSSGFDYPVGNINAQGEYTGNDNIVYNGWYIASTFMDKDYKKKRRSYHPGEDWNGTGGGNTDLGQPVYSVSEGVVVQTITHSSWGGIIKIKHRLPQQDICSLYIHLNDILVNEGEDIERRQQIATIGNANGNYLAHLHFEIRDCLLPAYFWPGGNQLSKQIIDANYYPPSEFIEQHRTIQ